MTNQPDFSARNNHPDFDDHINDRLKNYIYGLFDPETKRPFYIGKGGGTASKGNQRVLHHFAEARNHTPEDAEESAKIARIREIWTRGQDVEWKILDHGLDEATALAVESALIGTLSLIEPLTNIQRGHHSGLLGSPAEVYAWAAKPFDAATCPQALRGRPIFLFNISRSFANNADFNRDEAIRHHAEDVTRRAWKVSEHWRARRGIALGLVNGIARSAIRIDGWKPTDKTRKKWEIHGPGLVTPDCDFTEEEIAALVSRSFRNAVVDECKGYWQRGNHIIFEVSKEGMPLVNILRGKGVRQPATDPAE